MSYDSQIVQDLLPGTGSLGSAPQHHDYKRMVIRSAPKKFTVECLPPKKLGSGYCYGLHVLPIVEEAALASSAASTKSGASSAEYEIWRRWEDCLWFQELLENEYKLMARTKRIRLARGKGVKKDGMYMQSEAASFDSLPPGPDAKDIAKDVHAILPKLTKKGTLFRASQATIEQRAKEFVALIEALFDEDVPTLVKDLRDNRIIRDFFGYWRRDKDHDRKASEEKRPNRGSRVSISSSALYFSASNISLQLPIVFQDIPSSPSLPSAKGKEKMKARVVTKSASFSSSSSGSSRGGPNTPASAPAGMSFTVSDSGALIPTSPTSEDDSYFKALMNGPATAPIRSSSARHSRGRTGDKSHGFGHDSASESEDNSIFFAPESPWSPSLNADIHRPRNLEALPEEHELVPGMANMTLAGRDALPPPTRRPRNYSCPDPHNRNGLIFVTPPEASKVTGELHDDASVADSVPSDGGFLSDKLPDTPVTNSSSSKHTSAALSSFSGDFSQRSSWRTSLDSATSVPSHELDAESSAELEDMFGTSPPMISRSPGMASYLDPMGTSPRRNRMSIMTMNSFMSDTSVDAVLPRRAISPIREVTSLRRSMSTGSRYSRDSIMASHHMSPEEAWFEGDGIMEDELLDAYFYDPGLRTSRASSVVGHELPPAERDSLVLTKQISMQFPQPPQSPVTDVVSHMSSPPSSPQASIMSITSNPPSSPSAVGDSITIKAVRQDSIVLIRASHSTSLSDLRNKIRDKFASQEGVTLTDTFTVGFNPTVTAADDRTKSFGGKGRPRSQSTSAIGHLGQARLRFLIYEEDWQQAVTSSPGKVTLHIFDRF
ncbi:hypothetical protein BDW22DRAFT_132567 [Trametopsis cervina]|nr:hypothetical protein BDW22DRAFT_132567 [Trametopsis cervina]